MEKYCNIIIKFKIEFNFYYKITILFKLQQEIKLNLSFMDKHKIIYRISFINCSNKKTVVNYLILLLQAYHYIFTYISLFFSLLFSLLSFFSFFLFPFFFLFFTFVILSKTTFAKDSEIITKLEN